MSGLGVGLTPMETRREVVLHVARRAEELGYDRFSVAEAWGWDAGVLLAEGLHDVPFDRPVEHLAAVTVQVRRLLRASASSRRRVRGACGWASRRARTWPSTSPPSAPARSAGPVRWRTAGTRSSCRCPVSGVSAKGCGRARRTPLTIHGDAAQGRAALERWRDAGAEEPAIVLPPGRPVEELDHVLEALAPQPRSS